jgi:prolyl oligopeptidase
MVRYHRFGSGMTWIQEYGAADDPEQFRTLYAYSPYHRLVPGTCYPALLLLTADSDDRVDPMHARKFAAAVRHASRGQRAVLLRVGRNSGHSGADLVKEAVEQQADQFAFLLHELGVR